MAFIRKINQGISRTQTSTIPSSLEIVLSRVPLREDPSTVTVVAGAISFVEIFEGSPAASQFSVDYFGGTKKVYFNSADETTEVVISYKDYGDIVISQDVNELQEAIEDLETEIIDVKSWRAPVANQAALPSSGNIAGDVRLTLDNGKLYRWTGSAWSEIAGGGGAVTSVNGETGDVVLDYADVGAAPTAHTHNVEVLPTITGTVGQVLTNDGDGTTSWQDSGVPADILDIPTAETDPTLVLAPDGAGGVEFRAEVGGAVAFTDLTDVPSSYTGQANKIVSVNAGEDALEFIDNTGYIPSRTIYIDPLATAIPNKVFIDSTTAAAFLNGLIVVSGDKWFVKIVGTVGSAGSPQTVTVTKAGLYLTLLGDVSLNNISRLYDRWTINTEQLIVKDIMLSGTFNSNATSGNSFESCRGNVNSTTYVTLKECQFGTLHLNGGTLNLYNSNLNELTLGVTGLSIDLFYSSINTLDFGTYDATINYYEASNINSETDPGTITRTYNRELQGKDPTLDQSFVTKGYADINYGSSKYSTSQLLDASGGPADSATVTHNLGTLDVDVEAYDSTNVSALSVLKVERKTINTIEITNLAPVSETYDIIVS